MLPVYIHAFINKYIRTYMVLADSDVLFSFRCKMSWKQYLWIARKSGNMDEDRLHLPCRYSVFILSFPRDSSLDFYFSDSEIIFRGEICKILKDKLLQKCFHCLIFIRIKVSVSILNIVCTMSSETINQAMDTDNWDTVRDLLPSLSKKELEKKYGVSSEHTA